MDITIMIKAAITLLFAVITGVIIPHIRAKTTEAQRENLRAWVEIAVSCAEQLYKNYEKAGEEKKAFVLDFLEGRGITFDAKAIDAMIEAEVLRLAMSE